MTQRWTKFLMKLCYSDIIVITFPALLHTLIPRLLHPWYSYSWFWFSHQETIRLHYV